MVGLVGVVAYVAMAVEVERVVAGGDFSDFQRHPHCQYAYHCLQEIVLDLLVGHHCHEPVLQWGAGLPK